MVKPEGYHKGTFYSAVGIMAASPVIFCIICSSLAASTVWERGDISVCFPMPKNCNENCLSSLSNRFSSRSGPWAPLLLSRVELSQAAACTTTALRGSHKEEAPDKSSSQKTKWKQVEQCLVLTVCWKQKSDLLPGLRSEKSCSSRFGSKEKLSCILIIQLSTACHGRWNHIHFLSRVLSVAYKFASVA